MGILIIIYISIEVKYVTSYKNNDKRKDNRTLNKI